MAPYVSSNHVCHIHGADAEIPGLCETPGMIWTPKLVLLQAYSLSCTAEGIRQVSGWASGLPL